MRYSQTLVILAALLLVARLPGVTHAQDRLRINEFMAVNEHGLDDGDRDEEDWIEIHNAGMNSVNLEGWYLTDTAGNLTKWKFPAVTLGSDTYLIVFASGKDRADAAGELHTSFKLTGSGEYLGLVRPDGVTVVSEFSPVFPIQAPDVSYGLSGETTQQVLLAQGAPAKALVPLNDSLEPKSPSSPRPWTLESFDDSAWLSGATGVGFSFPRQVGLDVSAMQNVNETVYVRVPFVVEDPSLVRALTLRMWFEDGMIVYINGREAARYNAPPAGTETWNSGAPANWPTARFLSPLDFNVRPFDFLHAGTNVLAAQGLNNGVNNGDLLVLPELQVAVSGAMPVFRYFPTPTPGKPNNPGIDTIGPVITDGAHDPPTPLESEDLRITARIAPASAPLISVQLHYRVMFNAEVTIPLRDDGNSGDDKAGDGLYGATIPTTAFRAGQMVRWYTTAADTAGYASRSPAFPDPVNSAQYDGTVVVDLSLNNPLPVLHWFVENPGAANSDAGTRCSLFYDGQFYDNVRIYLHGQSSRGFPKKSYNIDFNAGHNFKWAPGEPRADDLNLLTTYPDKAQMRNILAHGTYRDADCPHHWVFPVRVQQNGAFWGTAHAMENGDEDWLIRMGLNAEGALYKMYNTFTSPSHAAIGAQNAEKKTRLYEDSADLLALYNGVSLAGEARRQYVYDNVDIPQVVNFLAARAMMGDTDCCHKNYYFYRDTGGSDEWQMWPWDVDLSFGRRWISSLTYWDQRLIVDTPLFIGNNNRVPQAIFSIPETRQMYLRRMRTLMDELLKPPGTPTEALHYEPLIDELAAVLTPDAALDAAKWGSHAWGNGSTAPCCPQSLSQAVTELKAYYLPERRKQLFNRLASGANELPGAQPAGAAVIFGVIETNPAGGNRDEQYVQLLNPNSIAVDISGWTLNPGKDPQAHLFTFRGGTVIPAGGILYMAASRPAFRTRRVSPTGGQALFVVGDLARRLSVQGEIVDLVNREGAIVASTGGR